MRMALSQIVDESLSVGYCPSLMIMNQFSNPMNRKTGNLLSASTNSLRTCTVSFLVVSLYRIGIFNVFASEFWTMICVESFDFLLQRIYSGLKLHYGTIFLIVLFQVRRYIQFLFACSFFAWFFVVCYFLFFIVSSKRS